MAEEPANDSNPSTPTSENTEPAPKRRRLKVAINWSQEEVPESHECVADRRAAFMFWVTIAWLVLLGLMMPHDISETADQAFFLNPILCVPFVLLWVIILGESLLGFATAHCKLGPSFKRLILISLLPMFRLTTATAYPPRFVWLPRRGWLNMGKLNFERVELRMAFPMVLLTLAVLPLLGMEFLLGDFLDANLWLASILHVLTALLWFGFTVEFLIMLSLAEKKIAYCKAHWINIIIIIMPLIMWLRLVRALSFLRIAKASKMVRAFRLRSITARGMRLAMVFNLVDRLMERNPEKYAQALEEKVLEKQTELQVLEERLAEVRSKIEADAQADQTEPSTAPDSSAA